MRSLVRAQLLLLMRWGIGPACVIAYAVCMALTVAVFLWNPGSFASSLREAGAISEGAAWLVAEGAATGTVSITWTQAIGATLIANAGMPWFTCLAIASAAAQDFETGAVRTVLASSGMRSLYVPARLVVSLPLAAVLFALAALAAPLICTGCGIAVVGVSAAEALAWFAQLMLVLLAYLALVLLVVVTSKGTVASVAIALLLTLGILESALTSLLYFLGSAGFASQLTLGAARAMDTGSLSAIMDVLAGGHTAGPVGFVVPAIVLVVGAGVATLVMRRCELGR